MTDTDSILDAWFAAFLVDGWNTARIDAVARLAGASVGEVADSFPDRWSALRGMQRRLDRAALVEAGSDTAASVRDRLFAVLMARFDAAQPQRAAITQLASVARRDPGLTAYFTATVPPSVARIAAAAGVDTTGLIGPLRVQGLLLLYARAARVWLTDDSADLAATMRALDADLERAERIARLTPHRAAKAPEVPRSTADRLLE